MPVKTIVAGTLIFLAVAAVVTSVFVVLVAITALAGWTAGP